MYKTLRRLRISRNFFLLARAYKKVNTRSNFYGTMKDNILESGLLQFWIHIFLFQGSTLDCCFLPHQVVDRSSHTADPPAGGYVDLNATVCSPLLRRATGGANAYCDTGYDRLELANRSLVLHQLETPDLLDSNWFWDLVTHHTSSSGSNSGSENSWTVVSAITSSGAARRWQAPPQVTLVTALIALICYYVECRRYMLILEYLQAPS